MRKRDIFVWVYIAVVLIAFVAALVLPAPYWRYPGYVTWLGFLGPVVFRFWERVPADRKE